ncbi:hypothetical protein [Acidithiobacillus ferriphilus]|uniref:hypothetical protein n=1 Tax=Acidithiobacillus ferriphilus TaxID=1689834 RepID=UPI001C06BC75|nr:hypothetical protein [Acidithiobacillus ferriphilus]MBU2831885.1 hypothetical protein [Acidithiobacillus ferriphilus]
MAAVLTETREQEAESLWKSKVDDRGQTHVYLKTTAGVLKVGDHILEHIAGHRRQVATPVLGIKQVQDGVIVTIPDRHADNAPVDELYPFNQPVFISKTPHLEQHDPNQNIFFQLERKDIGMDTALEKAREGMRSAQFKISAGVENMILTQDPDRAKESALAVRKGCGDLSDQIILGADAVAESRIKDAAEFSRWTTLLSSSADFTRVRSDRLGTYAQAVENPELREHAAYAQGALDTATQVALEQRRRGILTSLNGPLAEYALQDAAYVGLISEQPEKEESGVMLAKVSKHAVLQREDGTLVAVPVPDASILRRIEVGKPVDLIATGSGVYVRNEAMEKQTEVKKQEYPRMESHMKGPDGTWHSTTFYVDKEGHPRGGVAVENREQGIIEKHSVTFSEKVSGKNGEKFLSTKVDRENGKTLYINIMPHEKDGNRWLSASYAERDPSKERGQQLAPITGKGGDLKPNATLLEKADKDRTAQYSRETLRVDPVKVHARDQARGKGLGE